LNFRVLPGSQERWHSASIALVVIGVTLGIFDHVRWSAILVAIGTGIYAYTQFTGSEKKRRMEFFIPILVSIILFVVALVLPHAR
jgi:uncharacterized membrane protein YidH (DUF202 family)